MPRLRHAPPASDPCRPDPSHHAMAPDRAVQRLAYSIDELAAATSCSRSAIYAQVAEGRLATRKLNGRTLVLRADALAWLENLPVAPKRGGGPARAAACRSPLGAAGGRGGDAPGGAGGGARARGWGR